MPWPARLANQSAPRLTAKKFLAAANFIELLSIFGEISSEVRPPLSLSSPLELNYIAFQNLDKVKYAKWKASDIAKAFREGRKPVPGPAGGLAEDEELGSAEVSSDEAKELAKELATLGSADERGDAVLSKGSPAQSTRSSITAVSPPAGSAPPSATESYPFPDSSEVPMLSPGPIPEEYEQPQTPAFPSFLNTPTTTPGEPCEGESGTPTPPADAPPPLPPTHQTSDLAPPPFHPPSAPPPFPSAVLPTAPALPHPAPSAPAPPAPPPHVAHVAHTAMPESLDPMVIASIQKHAKWAISALNYDDLDTARKELRAALAMLGG